MTTLPWLIVPGFLVPSLMFIHVVIVYRLARQAAKPPARARIPGLRRAGRDETGLKRATLELAPWRRHVRLSSGPGGRRIRPGRARSDRKRRRATLPVSAPPPVPSGVGYALRLGERDGHEAGAVGGLNPHQHRLLALALGARDPGLHVLGASTPACRRHRG